MKNLALLLVSMAISVFLVEVVLRIAGFGTRELTPDIFFKDGEETTWSVPDSQLGWVNKAGVSASIEAGEAPMTFWDQGRRATRGDPTEPREGVPVLLVGGSNAQSYGVADHETFPYVLGQRFQEMWIENFGNGGYSTVQALLMAERAVNEFYGGLAPELIILTFADSHLVRNVSDQSWVYSISDSQGRYVSPPHFRLDGEQLTFHSFQAIAPWPLETSSALITTLHNVWLQSFLFNTIEESVPVTRKVMDQFFEYATSIGSDFLVVTLEDRTQISESLFEGVPFPILDCSGYERSNPEEYLLGGDGHPNAKLHTHFADCLGGWVAEYFESHLLEGAR
ncbi:MAG: hypothetical protein P8L66_14345 [Rhodospirillaceae bacterium]|nr:hypothetical protein [Rhodospirillaceae bacterium]